MCVFLTSLQLSWVVNNGDISQEIISGNGESLNEEA